MNWKDVLKQRGPETREKIVARWHGILADPTSIDTAKRMAREALKNLNRAEQTREPGQDDEENREERHAQTQE